MPTYNSTPRSALNSGDPQMQAAALQKIKAGNQAAKIKVTFAALTSAAAIDITTAAAKAAATVLGIVLKTDENLPPVGQVLSCRVTAGTAAAGPRVITDVGGTPDATAGQLAVATISDDGATLTFEAAVTGFVLCYTPAPAVSVDVDLNTPAP